MEAIYLDHNATTPLLSEAWEAMRDVPPGNPSSAHSAGRKARRALEDARERVAALLGASPDEVTFTSGATEANNLAVFGLVRPTPQPSPWREGESAGGSSDVTGEPGTHSPLPGGRGAGGVGLLCLASHIEHPCVIEPLKQLEARGVRVEWLPVDARGVVRGHAPPSGALICLMLANHETGAVQPVREVAASLTAGARLHCDAAQAVGKIPVHFRELGATTLSASAHKFGGPKGVGVLLTKRGTDLKPLTFGGHQQHGRRPGTEPVPLAVGMAVALEVAVRNMDANRAKLESLRERFWLNLQRDCPPVVLNGPAIGSPDVVPTTVNVSFPGCRADLLLMAFDLVGVACSTGSACSSGSLLPSPVLRAMGVPDDVLRSALRFSFSAAQALAEMDEATRRIAECAGRLRGSPSDP